MKPTNLARGLFGRAAMACALAFGLVATATPSALADTAKELVVRAGQIRTERVIWNPHGATAPSSPFTPRGPGCPQLTASVANAFNSVDTGSEITLQAGMVENEGFGTTYTVADPVPGTATINEAFPIEINMVEFIAGTAGTLSGSDGSNIRLGWRIDVWDGEPGVGNSTVVFSVDSDPDPGSTGMPGDLLLQRISGAPCDELSVLLGGASASAAKMQFSVDQTADPTDRIFVPGTATDAGGNRLNTFTVVVKIMHHNAAGAGNCASVDLCNNAFLATEGSSNTLTYSARNWLDAISCPAGAPAGYTRFSNLSTTYRPTRDVLQQVTYTPAACVGVASGACCSTSGICSVGTQAVCSGTSAYQGDGTTCTASSCPTGACCTVNGVCTPTTQPGCAGGNTFQGLATVCAPNPCPQPSGACCISGACSTSTQTTCSGSFQGAGTTCGTITCPQPTGACCFGTGCLTAAASDCASAGGVFQNGVACSGSACPTGACCVVTTGACSTATPAACTSGGGTYRGTGVACSTTSCPPPTGACCSTNGFCLPSQTQADCTNAGLTWKGGGTVCSPNPCSAPTGTCCRGALCSTGVAQANCTAPSAIIGAAYVSSTGTCNSAGNGHAPCCYADFNKVNGIGVQDIFDYLNAWFTVSPYCRVGGDGTATPGVQDIFDFLNVWFAGGC